MRIVLLHGLARTSRSMRVLERTLAAAGHAPHRVGYRSRTAPLVAHAGAVARQLDALGLGAGGGDVGFVCHSMGGLVLRALAQVRPGFRCGRAVLLGCPIHGSILAERLGHVTPVRALFGPALADIARARLDRLPPPPCDELGAIAGTRWSPLLPGAFFLEVWARGRPSDGAVLVEETQTPHAVDHVTVPVIHTLLPTSRAVHAQVLAFLADGRFRHS